MSDNRNPGCLDLLRAAAGDDGEARESAATIFTRLCAVALFCDCACATVFALSGSNWSTASTWQSLQDADLTSFSTQAWDCVLLTFLRALLFPSLVAITIRAGNYAPGRDASCSTSSVKFVRPASMAKDLEGPGAISNLYEPLIEDESGARCGGGGGGGHSGGGGACCGGRGNGSSGGHQQHGAAAPAAVAAEEAHETALAFAGRLKHAGVGTLFVLSTAFQLFVGLKVSAYDRFGQGAAHSYSLQVALLCCSVFWVNLEVYALRSLVGEMTRQSGLFLPAIHPHPLFKHKGVALHWCDVCSTKIQGGEAWRCKLCDFDMCPKCAGRKDVATVAENLLRGDKGRRQEKQLSSFEYLKRALGLASQGNGWLLYGAFGLLFCYTATNLLLPDYQGKIIDRVANGQRSGFYDAVQTYLAIMALQGLFSAGFNASFSVVSRKVLFGVRTKLFENVLDQDVAFFDGTTSGHLTSRYQAADTSSPSSSSQTTALIAAATASAASTSAASAAVANHHPTPLSTNNTTSRGNQ